MSKYLTPAQVVELLQVTRRTVYAWILSGRLPAYKAGNVVRIKCEDVEAFLVPIEREGANANAW
jgi:excisionase family DNA binding protein